jgi:hypothetical protein
MLESSQQPGRQAPWAGGFFLHELAFDLCCPRHIANRRTRAAPCKVRAHRSFDDSDEVFEDGSRKAVGTNR